jgi:hypothetical protein
MVNKYFIEGFNSKSYSLIMLSKEEKLKYGEALRQQVLLS